jgi:hypothetical protein
MEPLSAIRTTTFDERWDTHLVVWSVESMGGPPETESCGLSVSDARIFLDAYEELGLESSPLTGSYDSSRYADRFPAGIGGPIQTSLYFAFCGPVSHGSGDLTVSDAPNAHMGTSGFWWRAGVDGDPNAVGPATCADCLEAEHTPLESACSSCLCTHCPAQALACNTTCRELVACVAATCPDAPPYSQEQNDCANAHCSEFLSEVQSALIIASCVLDECRTDCVP